MPKEKLDFFCKTNHQGLVARIFPSGFCTVEEIWKKIKISKFPLILALDCVQDQGNIGVLARTLFCLGGIALTITKYKSAFLGERAFKSSAGALHYLSVLQVNNMANFLSQCQEKGCFVYYAGLDDDCKNLYETSLRWPAVLVLGNEEKGVRPRVKKFCNEGIKIPQYRDFNSLNVAQAGAIIIGEFFRQKFFL